MTRLSLLSLLAVGCGNDVVGTWQIDTLVSGDVELEDAGFVDFQEEGAASTSSPLAYLFRYTFDPGTATWVPDPTPRARFGTFDFVNYQKDGEGTVELVIDLDADGIGQASLLFDYGFPERRQLTLEAGPEALGTPVTLHLVR